MSNPVYKNEFDKPVFAVNNAHIKKLADGARNTPYGKQYYELQLNMEYFIISEDMLETISTITRAPEGVSISIG